MTGPGTVPPNVQPWYVTPFAISIVASLIGMRNSLIVGVDSRRETRVVGWRRGADNLVEVDSLYDARHDVLR